MLYIRSQVAKTTSPASNLYIARSAATDDWFGHLRDAYAIHNVLSWRPELPFWVIRWDGGDGLEWMELGDPRQRIKPFHFEIFFGKEAVRDAHYSEALVAASRRKSVLVKELFGFSDLLYRLPVDDGNLHTFLYAGQFCRETPTWQSVSEQWRAISGREPASADKDFVHFVKMALSLPVLGEELLEAFGEFVELYGDFLTGQGEDEEMQERVDALNRDYFSRLWPVDHWMQSAVSPDKFHLTPWYHEGKLTDWMKEGMGIERLPTTAMALMPLDARGDAVDPVRTLVRNAEIQRECARFARAMPETAVTSLSDYGVSLITSTRRSKSAARARLELRERAQKLQRFVEERFGVRAVVGIGSTLAAGSALHASHREAVLALHMCVQLEKDVLFHDEHGDVVQYRYADLQRTGGELMAAFDRENNTEIKLSSDRFVQVVLSYSDERIEVARSQLLSMLFQIFSAIERRYPMRHDARDSFVNELTSRLEESESLSQVIESFKEALSRLSFVASRALHGPKVMRLEATLQYLRENFAEPLPLPEVARKAGFSVPAFSRVFKAATGTSFLSYVRNLRVEHAKKLLTTTQMTTEQIAQACGFRSPHHLIRSFKKVTDTTPGAYRRDHGGRAA